MSTKIIPTVGRIVWFYPVANQQTAGLAPPAAGEPLAAIIARVVDADAGAVHLAVFDANGTSRSEPYVRLVQDGEKAPYEGRYATWMPYQIDQAKKAGDREFIAKQMAVASDRAADARRLHAGAQDMALRTPGLNCHDDVLAAARAYQAHIEGEAIPGTRLVSEREKAMEELLRSACAIADRKGEGTAWERFANSIHDLGLNGVTARTYRVLQSDVE